MFRDPLKKPMESTQLIGWILYVLIVLVSIWATGESLSRSFKIPLPVGYFVGFIISSACAAFLTIIKKGMEQRFALKIILAAVSFLFVWMISLLTNTHQFYLVGTLDKIKKDELLNAKNQIENLRNNGLTLFDQGIRDFERRVKGLNTSLQSEITDEGKPGLGPKAEKKIVEIEELLKMQVTRLQATGTGGAAIRDLARRQANLVYDLIEQKSRTFQIPREEIRQYFAREEDDTIINQLTLAINEFSFKDMDVIDKTLADAYAYYHRTFNFIFERIEFIPEHDLDIEKYRNNLPNTPESKELEYIANSFNYVKKNKEFNQPKFLLAFAIAFAVDISAFIIFFFMALPSSKEWD